MNEWTPFEVLAVLSGAWWGKQFYFQQDNGMIYSRESGRYMTLDDAIAEFAKRIGVDG